MIYQGLPGRVSYIRANENYLEQTTYVAFSIDVDCVGRWFLG